MSLTSNQRDILRLIQRSKPDADGWYRVSKVVWPIVNGVLPDDLVETKASALGVAESAAKQNGATGAMIATSSVSIASTASSQHLRLP